VKQNKIERNSMLKFVQVKDSLLN